MKQTSASSNAKIKGFLLGLAATLCWASYYPFTRFVLGSDADSTDPFLLSFVRYLIISFFFLFIALSGGREKVVKAKELFAKEWKMLLLLALSGVIIQGLLVFIALRFTTAARCALMANASPIFTVIAAWLILKERISRGMISGMLLGFAGITLGMFAKSGDIYLLAGAETLLGDLLALISGLAWGIYTVLGVPVVRKYDFLLITFYVFFFGTLMMPLVMLCAGSPFDLTLTPKLWICMAVLGIGCGAIPFCFWFMALRYVESAKLGAFGYLSALLAAVSSILFLGEKLTFLFILSGIMMLGGIYLMMRGKGK